MRHLSGDNRFSCLDSCAAKLGMFLNVVGQDAHKERCCGRHEASEFKDKPNLDLVVEGHVHNAVSWVNGVLKKDNECGHEPPVLAVQGFSPTLQAHG